MQPGFGGGGFSLFCRAGCARKDASPAERSYDNMLIALHNVEAMPAPCNATKKKRGNSSIPYTVRTSCLLWFSTFSLPTELHGPIQLVLLGLEE